MGEKVRIPFKFIVRSVTWRPAGEAAPAEPKGQISFGPNSVPLPIEMRLYPDPAIDRLRERARREYYENKAAEAKAARRRAREAEEAQWEPMPIPPGASRLTASLYRNVLQRKQPPATSEPASDADAAADPWVGWDEVTDPVDASAVPNALASDLTFEEDAARSSAAGLDASNDGSETDGTRPSGQRLDQTSVGGSKPVADGADLSLLTGLNYPSLGGTSKSDAVQYASNDTTLSDAGTPTEEIADQPEHSKTKHPREHREKRRHRAIYTAAQLAARKAVQQAANRAQAETYLQNPNVVAFLQTVSAAEHGGVWDSEANYYSMNSGDVTGSLATFPDTNYAAGAYQIERSGTYSQEVERLGLTDWSEHTQDLMAADLFALHGGVAALEAGDLAGAMKIASKTWAAVPKSTDDDQSTKIYLRGKRKGQRQPSMHYSKFVKMYQDNGGR